MAFRNTPVAGMFYELTDAEQSLIVSAMACNAMGKFASLDGAAQDYMEMSLEWGAWGDKDGGSKTYFEALQKDVARRLSDPEQAKIDDEEFARGFDEAHAESER